MTHKIHIFCFEVFQCVIIKKYHILGTVVSARREGWGPNAFRDVYSVQYTSLSTGEVERRECSELELRIREYDVSYVILELEAQLKRARRQVRKLETRRAELVPRETSSDKGRNS